MLLECLLSALVWHGAAVAVSADCSNQDPALLEQQESLQILRPVVGQEVFEKAVQRYDPDGLFHDTAERIWLDYIAAAREVDRRAMEDRREAGIEEIKALIAVIDPPRSPQRVRALGANQREGMKQLKREAEEHLNDPRWDTLDQLKNDVAAVSVAAQRRGDALRRAFVANLSDGLFLDSGGAASLERFILRSILLPTFGKESHDFRHRVNMLELVDAASTEPGELHACLQLLDEAGIDIFREFIEGSVLSYEIRLHAYLQQILDRRRRRVNRSESMKPTTFSSYSDPAVQDVLKRHRSDWTRQFRLGHDTLVVVEQHLVTLGFIEEARAWRERYYAALCPELVQKRLPDHLNEWLDSREDATAEQTAMAEELHEHYVNEQRWLMDRAISAGIRLMRDQIFPTAGDTHEQIVYGERLWALHELSRRTLSAFAATLTLQQRADLEQSVAHSITGRLDPTRLGPRIDSTTLQKIERVEAYDKPLWQP